VAAGVRGGIERTSLVLMPTLFALVAGLAIYAATLDGGGPGYAYYLRTDFEKILSLAVLKDATGQAFFSLSLGMGAMLTYGSYLTRDNDLPNESLVIAGADVGVAFVAGLVVFPLIFALGLSHQVSGQTVGALFITLPEAFAAMGTAGRFVGFAFFVVLLVGALTSAISLLEVVVSAAIDGLGWSRRRAAWASGGAIALLGIPPAFSLDVLGAMDEVANTVFLLGGGLALAVFVGWVMKDPMETVRPGAEGVQWFGLWRVFLRFAVLVFLLFVLWSAIPHTIETVSALFSGGSAAE
jgi:NSS family neurotransmitter:Na+ symporter